MLCWDHDEPLVSRAVVPGGEARSGRGYCGMVKAVGGDTPHGSSVSGVKLKSEGCRV